MKEKITIEQVKIGMFVSDLDRPWLDTPFLLQGFLVETPDEVSKLKQYCQYVIVDRLRSVDDEFRAESVGSASPVIRRDAAPKVRVFDNPAQQGSAAGAQSSLLGTLKTIIKETFASRPKPGGGTIATRVLTIHTVDPPRPRAPERQIVAHGITRDEAVTLEEDRVDLSGRPAYRPRALSV